MSIKGEKRMRLAICDDDENDLQLLKSMIARCSYAKDLALHCFDKAADLFRADESLNFDIAILDIEMAAPNGFEIAQRLKRRKPSVIIIFLTNSMDYTIRGYGVAFRYLTKPIRKEQLDLTLSAAVNEVKANRFVFAIDGVAHIIRMDDIFFFEVFNHHTVLHTPDSEYTFRATLKEVIDQLPVGYFGSPHQSYIVNFQHVKTATAKELHMTNGSVVPISRRRQQAFAVQFHSFLGR